MKACEVIVQERKSQLEDCRNDLVKKLKDALEKEKEIGKRLDDEPKESMFREYVRVSRTEGHGDEEGTQLVTKLLTTAGVGEHRPSNAGRKMKDSERKQTIWGHREQTHIIRRLTKELVGRVRSLRYFSIVRDLQKQRSEPPVVSCPECGRDKVKGDTLGVDDYEREGKGKHYGMKLEKVIDLIRYVPPCSYTCE